MCIRVLSRYRLFVVTRFMVIFSVEIRFATKMIQCQTRLTVYNLIFIRRYIIYVRWISINTNKNKLYVRNGRFQAYEWHFAIFFDVVRSPRTLGANNHFRPVRPVTCVHGFDGETTYVKRQTQGVQSKHTNKLLLSIPYFYFLPGYYSYTMVNVPVKRTHIIRIAYYYVQHLVCFIFPRSRPLADIAVM